MNSDAAILSTLVRGAVWYCALLFSLCLHEAAHAWAALKGGDETAWRNGQVSLNPLPHIRREPIGTVVVPLIAYFIGGWMIGWASTPYDTVWAERYPRRSALMSLAGPLANLLIALCAFLLLKWGFSEEVLAKPSRIAFDQLAAARSAGWEAPARLLSVMLVLNLVLLVFNLFPLPPMDGSKIVGLFLPAGLLATYTHWLHKPAMGWIGLVLAWFLFPMLFYPAFRLTLYLLYSGVPGT